MTNDIDLDGLDAEDIACLGMRRADRCELFAEIEREVAAETAALRKAKATAALNVADQKAAPATKPRRRHLPRISVPDGLRTEAEAAAKLGISIRTLREHVAAGSLRYVNVGRGKQRARRRFADADLDQFIKNQSREDSPCPSIAPAGRRTGTMTFGGEVVAFTALQKRPRGGKPKR